MKIFLVIPPSKENNDIIESIKRVVEISNHQLINLELDDNDNGETFDEKMHKVIQSSDIVIADVGNENVILMYQLGIANSLKKTILPIIQKDKTIPFDVNSIKTLIYDRNRLNDTLSIPLLNFLDHTNFEKFIIEEKEKYKEERKRKKTVFISYSHIDSQYLDRLKVHLKPFEKKGLIDLWEDSKIKVGEKWKEKIEKALEKSVIAILLISADFLASDFIIDNELPPLLKSAEDNGKKIIPVILKPCRFSRDENLSKFQAINDPKIPLSKMDDNGKEEIYSEISDYIDDYLR